MKVENSGCVAVVDESGEILFLQEALQTSLSPVPVIGFDDSKQFVETILNRQRQNPYVWLVVIADFSALWPTLEEGVFCLLGNRIPNFRGVAFTAHPDDPGWQELVGRKLIASDKHVIPRAEADAVSAISKVIQKIVKELSEFVDFINKRPGRGQEMSDTRPESLGTRVVKANNKISASKTKRAECIIPKKDSERIARTAMDGKAKPSGQKETPDQDRVQNSVKQPETVIRLEDLVRPKTYLHRLLSKDTLSFFERLVLKEVAWDLFTRLSRDNREYMAKYRDFIDSETCPKGKEGLQIFGDVLMCFMAHERSRNRGRRRWRIN